MIDRTNYNRFLALEEQIDTLRRKQYEILWAMEKLKPERPTGRNPWTFSHTVPLKSTTGLVLQELLQYSEEWEEYELFYPDSFRKEVPQTSVTYYRTPEGILTKLHGGTLVLNTPRLIPEDTWNQALSGNIEVLQGYSNYPLVNVPVEE